MNPLTSKNWIKIYGNSNVSQGLQLKSNSGVDIEVRAACKEFCKWLRNEFSFPIRVPIYLKSAERIKATDGDLVCRTFFEPNDRFVEPYIRIATGDYEELREKYGRDDALATILRSFAHEIVHYLQWINGFEQTDTEAERQAERYSKEILNMYAKTREHP